jgi:hypothetical protein
MVKDEREIGLIFINNDDAGLRWRPFIEERLQGYLGASVRLVDIPISRRGRFDTQYAIEQARKVSKSITDIAVVEVTTDDHSRGSVIQKEAVGTIYFYSIDTGQMITTKSFTASASVDRDRGILLNTLGFIYNIGIVFPIMLATIPFSRSFWSCPTNPGPERKACEKSYGPDLTDRITDRIWYVSEKSSETVASELVGLTSGVDGTIKEAVKDYAAFLKENTVPPMLVASVNFSDDRGLYPNGSLDAEEQAELVLTLENKGKGVAYGVTPIVTAEGKGFSIKDPELLETIRGGERKQILIRIEGKSDLGDGLVDVKIKVRERRREHDAKPVTLTLQTGRLKPPDLIIEAREDALDDRLSGNGDHKLGAYERAELVVKVHNRGEGMAYDVNPVFSILEGKGFTLDHPDSLGTIPAGATKEVRIPVMGGLDLISGKAKLQIEAKEKRGYDARKLTIAFQTDRLKRPNLVIKEEYRVNDGTAGQARGNGNGILENTETAEVDVLIENTGEGDAVGVRLSLIEASSDIQIIDGESKIGRIGVGETAKGKVVIQAPRRLQLKDLTIKFRAEEVERKAANTEKVFALKTSSLTPDLVANLEWSDAPSGKSHGNGNGVWESGEIITGVLTVQNRGKLAAEGVKVTVRVTKGGMTLERGQFSIDRLGPNQTSDPFRTTLTIPRTFKGQEVAIETIVEQQDFEKVVKDQSHAISLLKPELVVMNELLNQPGGDGDTMGSVQQGDMTSKMKIQVRNKGNLEARNVIVSVISERSEIRLEGERNYPIGTILPGQASEPIVIPLAVQRAASVGLAGVKIEITQEDFPFIKQAGMLMVREEGAEEVKVSGREIKTPKSVAPVVATASPIYMISISPAESVSQDYFELLWDKVGEVTNLEITVNGKGVSMQHDRGIGLSKKNAEKRQTERIPLSPGPNTIIVTAFDLENKKWEQEPITVIRRVGHGEFWAVLIGINDYEHWPKLSTAVGDVEGLRKVLEGQYGFAPHRIKLVKDREATQDGIIDAFDWLTNAREEDNVLIYFGGHGELDQVTGYWVPVDAKRDKKGAYIRNSTIRDYIAALKAKHVYLVADSCFSGSLFAGVTRSKPPATTDRYYQEAYSRKSRQAITSGGNEPVSDAGYDGHSIFAYYFLNALRDNKEPYLTATKLFTTIAPPIGNNSKQTPISQPIKDVQDEGGEFIFGLGGQIP